MDTSRATVRTVAGVDIGGTKVTFILWSGGSVAYRIVLPYAARSSREFSALIVKGMDDLRRQATEAGIAIMGTGIGCAGMVDQKHGVLLFPPNMPGVRDVPLADIVSGFIGAPAYLENDANCALFAEWVSGVAVGRRNVVMFSVGTGVGGALIVDGHLYVGRHGFAGEIGHLPMVDRGLPCGCGGHGCLETIASGTGIERYVRSALARGSKSLMTMEDAGSARTISESEIVRADPASSIVIRLFDPRASALLTYRSMPVPEALVSRQPCRPQPHFRPRSTMGRCPISVSYTHL